jgi:hypothetical protein
LIILYHEDVSLIVVFLSGLELLREVPRTSLGDPARPFLKVRGDLAVPKLRPVQLGPIQSRPPPLIRIKPDSPVVSPPRMAMISPPRPGLIQQRPVGTPGNLSGVVNVIPRQNGSGPKVLPGIPSPKTTSPPCLVLPSSQPVVRPLNRISLSSSSAASPPTPTGSVLGIKNLTPLADSGSTPRLTNFRPVQVCLSWCLLCS